MLLALLALVDTSQACLVPRIATQASSYSAHTWAFELHTIDHVGGIRRFQLYGR